MLYPTKVSVNDVSGLSQESSKQLYGNEYEWVKNKFLIGFNCPKACIINIHAITVKSNFFMSFNFEYSLCYVIGYD